MKLLHKTSLYYLFYVIPAMTLAGFASYFIINNKVKESNDELLLKRKSQIESYIANRDTAIINLIRFEDEANIVGVNRPMGQVDIFSDTTIFDAKENEYDPYRLLTSTVSNQHGTYIIRVWRSAIEFEELVSGIATSLSVVLIILFGLFLTINWWVSHTLWKPFYSTIDNLQKFRVQEKNIPNVEDSSIKEFSDLNVSVSTMMQKMLTDFASQKQFAENASHEMQTPLAIIKSKIDLLIQSDRLEKKETDLILSIDDATAKLSRLSKSLLLLTKIENRQFEVVENVLLNKVVDDSLRMLEEQIEAKSITLTKNFTKEVNLTINPDLCYVLVNNLLQNAIRHNNQGGSIEILLNEQQLIASNTGLTATLDTDSLFNRFHKNSFAKESLGLGLAIAKEIADVSSLSLSYKYESDKHYFIIAFK
jgi:signal transduction histidine kinase